MTHPHSHDHGSSRGAAPAGGHGHAHGHTHRQDAGHGHDHAHHRLAGGPSAQRALAIALALTAGFAVIEAVGAWWAGSLALLSDAGHMVTDAASLGIALFAQRLAMRPQSPLARLFVSRAKRNAEGGGRTVAVEKLDEIYALSACR